MRSDQNTAGALRIYTGYNHTVPIGGQRHDVQTEFLAGDPAKIVSHAFLSGRVISSLTQEVGREDLEDELRVRELIKNQQKETIRQLVVAARALKPEPLPSSPPPSSPTPNSESVVRVEERARAPEGPRPPLEDIELRQVMVRVARAVEKAVPGSDPLATLADLVNRCAPIRSDAQGSRSHEMASLLLLRADAKDCLRDGDESRAARLVDELLRFARTFAAINSRAALLDHDREEWRRHLERLRSSSPDASPSTDDLQRLRLTWGRDEALDALLEDPANLRNQRLRVELTRAVEQLEREMQHG